MIGALEKKRKGKAAISWGEKSREYHAAKMGENWITRLVPTYAWRRNMARNERDAQKVG